MAKLSKKIVGRVAKKIGGAALNFVPGGSVVKGAAKLAGGLLGGKGKGGSPRKSRRKSAMYYLRRIPVEKAKAKLLKIKMSAYKGL